MSTHQSAMAAFLIAVVGATAIVPAQAHEMQTPAYERPSYIPNRLPKLTNECGFGDIYDWKALNDYTLIVWFNNDDNKNAKIVQLDQPCDALRFRDTIAFKSMNRFQLCSYGGDSVIAGGQRCTIGRIRAYRPAQASTAAEIKKTVALKPEGMPAGTSN